MPGPPSLADLVDAVVVLRDAEGRGARYVVDHVHDATAICSYVFRGRHVPPIRWEAGDPVELGAPSPRGWVVGHGHVGDAGATGAVTVVIDAVEVVQRRQAYREEIVVPFVLRELAGGKRRRGRTENLSAGGFAARMEGLPLDDGADVLVSLAMPEGDELTLPCRKIAGDLPQRFEFLELDTATEDRLVRLVRVTELARRRAGRAVD